MKPLYCPKCKELPLLPKGCMACSFHLHLDFFYVRLASSHFSVMAQPERRQPGAASLTPQAGSGASRGLPQPRGLQIRSLCFLELPDSGHLRWRDQVLFVGSINSEGHCTVLETPHREWQATAATPSALC